MILTSLFFLTFCASNILHIVVTFQTCAVTVYETFKITKYNVLGGAGGVYTIFKR